MTDPKLSDAEVAVTDNQEVPTFSAREAKADISFFLKSEHGLPKITVDYLLAQFEMVAKKDDGRGLAAVLEEVAETVRQKRGDNSPAYLAIRDYARNQGAAVRASIVPGQLSSAGEIKSEGTAQGEGLSGTTMNVADQVRALFSEEAPSAVRAIPDVMQMSLEGAIKYFFPSMGSMLVQTVRMKLVQGPTPEESGNLYWHVGFFTDLVTRFPDLKTDLEKKGLTVESMAGLLLALGQKESSRAEIARAERRGQMVTVPGIHVNDLHLYLAKERVVAAAKAAGKSTPPPKPPEVSEAAELPATAAENSEKADDNSRVTSVPAAPDIHSRETVTNEAGPASDPPEVQADSREARAEMETLVAEGETSTSDQTAEPKDETQIRSDADAKKEKGLRGALRKIFG